MIKMIFLLYC